MSLPQSQSVLRLRRSCLKLRAVLLLLPALALTSFAIAGCGSAPKKQAAAPAAAETKTDAASTASPTDLSPNTLHDRRADAGVRAPAKPLVLDNARSVKCGKLTKGADGDEADLLAGRLRVRAPAGSKAPAPTADAPPIEEESRIVASEGTTGTTSSSSSSSSSSKSKEKVVKQQLSLAIVARETFQLDPDLYEPEEGAPAKPGSLDVEAPKFLKATFPTSGSDEAMEVTPVEIGAPAAPKTMRGYVARPKNPNAPPGKDTALVLALLIAQDDGALESVAFYVRGETVRNATGSDLVGCTRLAERIASSITPGPRKLERAPGRRHIADVSKDEELAVTVPADYVAINGAAGTRLTKLRPLSLYAGSIVVALNASGAAKVPEGADATAAGKLLGHPMEWHGKTTPKGGFFFAAEPLAEDKTKTAEVLVKATRQAKALDEMRGVAETLAVVKRSAAAH